jgi:uncharacterized protein YaaQ
MKMILSILNTDDADNVLHALTRHGFAATCLASSGGFLAEANTTLFLGVDEERVQQAVHLIKEQTRSRKRTVSQGGARGGSFPRLPLDVAIGGVTIFVLDVEYFERA